MLRRALPYAAAALAAAVAKLSDAPGLALLIGLPALALGASRRQSPAFRLALAAVAVAAALAFATAPSILAVLLPSFGHALLALHFGLTLLPGREPLITRYTRHDFGYLPPECAGYTRALTALWTLLFALLVPLHAMVMLALPPFETADPGLVYAALLGFMLLLFLGEHPVRSLRFPQHGVATPARTLRAILSAHLS
ncbi:hypothetical protein ACFOD4_15530 [Pseudoroseomonas globiformis]|uniref:Uncharacterized protein n=1 Tax=Teichococcus globiformis TaxID=2307229 RepID=A0ABV7G4L6_9PROT